MIQRVNQITQESYSSVKISLEEIIKYVRLYTTPKVYDLIT